MRVEMHSDVARLEGEWARLADRAEATPFAHPGWVCAWWRAFGRGSLEIATAWRGERLAGVLPLQRRAGMITSPTNWHTPVFGPVLEDPDVAMPLLEAVLADRPRHFGLSFLDSEDPATEALTEAAADRRYRVATRTRLRSPYVAIDGDGDEVDRRLGGKRRRELRRRRRLLEAEGKLTFEVETGGDALEEHLEEAFRIEALGWKGARGSAIASSADTKAFYTEIACWASERGWLRLCFLRLDGRALACDFALEHDGCHYLVKTGYDPAFRAHGPGVLLRHEAIRRAAESGLRSYEFLGGAEPTKLEWADECRRRLLVQAFKPSPAGALDRIVFTHGRRLAVGLRDMLRR